MVGWLTNLLFTQLDLMFGIIGPNQAHDNLYGNAITKDVKSPYYYNDVKNPHYYKGCKTPYYYKGC